MGERGIAKGIGVATERLKEVVRGLRLATPDAVNDCAALLERTCRELEGVTGEARPCPGDAAVLAAGLELQNRVKEARRLLDGFYLFHARWDQLLGTRTSGYLPGGRPAPVSGGNRLYVRA